MDDHNPAVILQGYDKMCAMKTVGYLFLIKAEMGLYFHN